MAIRPPPCCPQKRLLPVGSSSSKGLALRQILVELSASELSHRAREGFRHLVLADAEAEQRLEEFGYNVVAPAEHHRPAHAARARLRQSAGDFAGGAWRRSRCLTGDIAGRGRDGFVVLLGVSLGFGKKRRPIPRAVSRSDDQRDGHRDPRRGGAEVPLAQIVPGDIVKLAAGDMIPADLRLLSSRTCS